MEGHPFCYKSIFTEEAAFLMIYLFQPKNIVFLFLESIIRLQLTFIQLK